jgi:hypothetical protein
MQATRDREIVTRAVSSEAETADPIMEELQAAIEAQVQAAIDAAAAAATGESATPARWWDMYAIGPFKAPIAPFPAPNQVVRLGETVYIASVLYLNQNYPTPGPSAADVLSNFALPYDLSWDGSNVTTWNKVFNGTLSRHLVPGQAFYVDIIRLNPATEGLHEVNLRCRIMGCGRVLAPPFAGYASMVSEFDSSLFSFGGHQRYQGPVRFDVYR